MIGELGRSIGDAVFRRAGRVYARFQRQAPLQADLVESEDSFLAVFDAPGADVEDVQVRFVDGRLLVRIDRFRPHHEGYEMRFPGRALSRDGEVALPEDAAVDSEAGDATLTDRGTLEVRLPKEESADREAVGADAG